VLWYAVWAKVARFTVLLEEATMPQGKEVFLGLNQTGVIVFVILLVTTGPCLCWIPWVIDGMKADKNVM
jgi:hypothetical protein